MRLTVAPELIDAARAGQGDAMERLLETLWPHAYRIARSIVHSDSLAEDAAQEACAIMYRGLHRLRSANAFRVWAYRIVAREAVRVAKRYAPESLPVDATVQPDLDIRVDTLRALSFLSPDLRAVVVLHYYAEMTSAEIAHALRIPSATVRFRLANARTRLAPLLDSAERFSAAPEVC